jgi:hypothetical protein
MRRKLGAKATIILAIALFQGTSAFCSDKSMPTISMCELVQHWQAYHGQEVRVRAIYSAQFVGRVLYDPSCTQKDEMAAELSDHLSKKVEKSFGKLDRLLDKDSKKRAWVVFEGIFYGPEPFTEDEISKMHPAVRELMKNTHRQYGFGNLDDYKIEVTKIIEFSKVDAKVPGLVE